LHSLLFIYVAYDIINITRVHILMRAALASVVRSRAFVQQVRVSNLTSYKYFWISYMLDIRTYIRYVRYTYVYTVCTVYIRIYGMYGIHTYIQSVLYAYVYTVYLRYVQFHTVAEPKVDGPNSKPKQ